MDQISDEDLMLRVQQGGDHDAFAELFRRYRAPVTSYVCRLVGEVAEGENLAQEAFLRLLEKRDLYTYPRRLSTWLFTIARNLTTDFQKKKRAMTSEAFDLIADAQRESDSRRPDAAGMQREATQALQEAIGRLQTAQREVLILRSFYEMSYREIAEVVGCPESTARSHMDCALKELKAYYRKLDREKGGIS